MNLGFKRASGPASQPSAAVACVLRHCRHIIRLAALSRGAATQRKRFGLFLAPMAGRQAWRLSLLRRCAALACVAGALLLPRAATAVGSWVPLTHIPPSAIPGTNYGGHMILLSDATVMVQDRSGPDWFRLVPDRTGGYTNGTWTNMASMRYSRDFYASVVLQDGRVLIAGGEHPNGGPQKTNSEVYVPLTNGWYDTLNAGVTFSDSESVILPDGTVIVHPLLGTNGPQLVMHYYPSLNNWTFGATNTGRQGETTWVKLPDDSILTINDNSQSAERYIPALDQWIKDARVPVNLFSNAETGAGFLLPDGRAFFLGASGHTALYQPTGSTNEGSWATGPDIPDGRYADDAPAAMMANGKVLCAVGALAPNGGSPPPMWFYEYDYTGQTRNSDGTVNTNGAFSPTSSPGNSKIGSSFSAFSYQLYLLDLPDGTVLFADNADPSGQLYVYKPDGSPLPAGKPTIYNVNYNTDHSVHLSGTLFNGISQGASFGDDAQQDSNYPLVRFTDGSGKVYYGRTFNWSSTSVMTGSKIVTTEATVPDAIVGSPGAYSLQVVANGIASDPFNFHSPEVWVDFNYTGSPQIGTYQNPFTNLAHGVSAVSSGGTVAFKANVQPSVSGETMTISKPMTLISVGGPSTVGH